MARGAVIVLTCAPPGAGKTYVRFARFVWDTWLPECAPGVHWSNFPVRFDRWTDEQGHEGPGLAALAADKYGLSDEDVRERVRVIPSAVVDEWRDDRRCEGPWTFFADKDINGAHIAIDEAHAFFPASGRPKHAKMLKDWLAEIRHRGATVEFITQHPGQVCKELVHACGERFILTNLENDREPMAGCRVGDWLELLAGWITGEYRSYVRQERVIQWGSSWKIADSRVFALDPWYFGLYDSFSAPLVSSGGAGMGQLAAWQRYGRLGLLWWFYKRNWFPLSWRAAAISAYVWVAFLGGGNVLVKEFERGVSGLVKAGAPGAVKSVGSGKKLPGSERGIGPDGGPAAVRGGVDYMNGQWVERRILPEEVDSVSERVREGVGALRANNEVMAKHCRELESRLGELGGAVMLCDGGVRFESGDFFRVGEAIDYGPYAGCRIVGIDSRRRAVRLNDGRLIRLGFERLSRAKAGSAAEVSGRVPGVGGDGFGGSASGGVGGGRSGIQQSGHSGGRSDSVSQRQDGLLDRGARGSGRQAGINGNQGRALGGSSGRVGGSTGSDVGSEGPSLLPRAESAGQSGSVGSSSSASER